MDFGLTDDETLFRQSVREFATAVIAPVTTVADRAGRLPTETLREAAALGLFGMLVPEEHGGAGLDTLRYALALEEIARASAALAAVVNAHNALVCAPLAASAATEQRARLLPTLARGATIGAGWWPSGMEHQEVVAWRSSDGWRLDGEAPWVANAAWAGLIVLAPVGAPAEDGRVFVVPADAPGLRVGPPLELVGLRGAGTAAVALSDCLIPTDCWLRAEPGPGDLGAETRALARLGSAAVALGIGGAALDAAVAYAGERRQFGRAIGEFEGLRGMLVGVHLAVEAARLFTYRAAWLRDRGQPWQTATAAAKLYAAEAAMLAATKAIQVHGGYEYMEESAVQRYFRDAKMIQAADESPQQQRVAIASDLLPAVGLNAPPSAPSR
jgi:alkylation response protein AidB-like acyl-CoA dehydrogenase